MLLKIGDSFGRRRQLDQYVFELLKLDVPSLFTIERDTVVKDKYAVFRFKQDLHTRILKNCEILSQMKEIRVSDYVSLATCNNWSVYFSLEAQYRDYNS